MMTASISRLALPLALALSSAALACKTEGREPAPSALPAAEPLHFTFTLPSHFVTLELFGEGSESLRAPPGARVTRVEGGARVEADSDFAIEIRRKARPLSELKSAIEPGRRKLEESDLVVFDVPAGNVPAGNVPAGNVPAGNVPASNVSASNAPAGGFGFISVRELVPEWDENDRRQFSCNSVGAGTVPAPNGAEVRAFSKAAVQDMVAACRTLELPRLE